MKALIRPALVASLAGVLAFAALSPLQARMRPWVGAGIGLAAGAAFAGAAAASSGYYGGYYDPGYDAYGYDPGYAVVLAYPNYDGYGYSGRSYNDFPEQSRARVLGGHDY